MHYCPHIVNVNIAYCLDIVKIFGLFFRQFRIERIYKKFSLNAFNLYCRKQSWCAYIQSDSIFTSLLLQNCRNKNCCWLSRYVRDDLTCLHPGEAKPGHKEVTKPTSCYNENATHSRSFLYEVSYKEVIFHLMPSLKNQFRLVLLFNK
jgi:hypothetical protein